MRWSNQSVTLDKFKGMQWYPWIIKVLLCSIWILSALYFALLFITSNRFIITDSPALAGKFSVVLFVIPFLALCSALAMYNLHTQVATLMQDENHGELHECLILLLQSAGLEERSIVARCYEDNVPGAFTISLPLRKRSLIAFSSRLLEIMPPGSDMFRAVAAHEITHIKNGDSSSKAFIRIFHSMISLIPEILEFLILDVIKSSWKYLSVLSVITLILLISVHNLPLETFWPILRFVSIPAAILFVVFCLRKLLEGIAQTYSRRREFVADRGAAAMVSPSAMISALEQVALFKAYESRFPGKTLFDSHPPVHLRIKQLQGMLPLNS